MKKFILLIFITVYLTTIALAQNVTDSLVRFSDLKYHSEFEKSAINNYLHKGTDTFNILLAIDENMNNVEALELFKVYTNIFNNLNEKNLDSKSLNKKIKIVYPVVHDYFLKKYNQNEYFPVMFQSGSYNCVSASMLYSLVFDHFKIPYKVMASSNHVYLIANPGENSVVIETTNPNFEKAIFTGEFKQQYVNYLRSSKLISESEYKNKSTEEIFEEKFNEVKEAKFSNLLGIQYYNKAISIIQSNKKGEVLELCKKAYLFFPDPQVENLLNSSLLLQIEKCNFEKVTDIDYLVQLSRFENTDLNYIIQTFNNIIDHFLQFTDKEEYCDSLFQRLTSQISNKTLLEEISFSYYLKMSQRFFESNKAEYYISNAIKIKSNHKYANTILLAFINDKFKRMYDPHVMLDTILRLENRYKYENITIVLNDYKKISFLKIAEELYKENNPAQGDKYLLQFENDCRFPVENQLLARSIESTYRSIAVYYYYKNQKTKAKSYIDKALKYVPNSILIKSAVYKD